MSAAKPGTLTATEDESEFSGNGKRVQIFDGDTRRAVVGGGMVLGVPPDGRTVAADGFVVGSARTVEVRQSMTCNNRQVVFCGGVGMYPGGMVIEHIFGALSAEGETAIYDIVRRPVPLPVPEETAVQEQTAATGRHDYDLLRAEAEDRQKVWLCCKDKNTFHVARGTSGMVERVSWGFKLHGWLRWKEVYVSYQRSLEVHPAHNLKPGECCEVPAREDGKPVPVPSAPPAAESEGPRWVNSEGVKDGEKFLCRHAADDMWYGVDENAPYTRRVDCSRKWYGVVYLYEHEENIGLESDTPELARVAHLAARERARQLGLIEAGPRPPADKISCGCSVGEFIGRFSSFERERNYYVGKMDGRDVIVRDYDFSWMPLVDDPPSELHSAKTWIDVSPKEPDAKAFRAAYDTALAANQLPPHPRYPRPEGATDWLGWFDSPEIKREFWWGYETATKSHGVYGVYDTGSVLFHSEHTDYQPGCSIWQALARARELGLPERAARKARLADLERQRAEIDGKIAELREVPNA